MALNIKKYSFVSLFVLTVTAFQFAYAQSSSSLQTPSFPSPQSAQVRANQETLIAMNDTLNQIRRELRELRNAVEELQFDGDVSARRQRDLYHDLDRRMIALEHGIQTGDQALDSTASVNYASGADSDTLQLTLDTDDLIDVAQPQDLDSSVVAIANDSEAETSSELTDVNQAQQIQQEETTEQQQVAQEETLQEETPQEETAQQDFSITNDEEQALLEKFSQQQEAYEQAFDLLKQSRYGESIEAFKQFVIDYADSALQDDAYYWLSEAYYVNREYEKALSNFRIVVSNYPDSDRVPNSLLKMGYIQYDVGAYEEAADIFRDVLKRFPGHKVTVAAQTRLHRIEQTIQ